MYFFLFIVIIVILFFANLADKHFQTSNDRLTKRNRNLSFLFIILIYLTLFSSVLFNLPLIKKVIGTGLGGPLFWIPGLLGILFLFRPIRRVVAMFLPIDINSMVHTVSLCLSMILFVEFFKDLGHLEDYKKAYIDASSNQVIISVWIQKILEMVLAFIGIGLLVRRNFRESLLRLGIVRPKLKYFFLGSSLTFLAILFSIIVGIIFPSSPVTGVKESLFMSAFGVITVSLSAALGEELVFRGALQPRFGIWFTSILFAVYHTDYGLTGSTLMVLGIGLILGWARNRYNTTLSMIVHALFNSAVVLLQYLV